MSGRPRIYPTRASGSPLVWSSAQPWAIADEGPKLAALAVTVGIAISLVPLLLRVLPPLAKDAATNKRDPDSAITLLGLVLYVGVVAGFLVLLDIN